MPTKALVVEAVGTFFLVLTIGLTVTQGTAFAPLAIGSVLMVMVYMGGPVSGGHYNPAVTLAVWMRGALPAKAVAPYMIAQVVGAVLASVAVLVIQEQTFAPEPAVGVSVFQALLVEFLYTFALASVVLHVATTTTTQGNSYFGLAIGFTIVVAAFAGGGISGGAFNPAVGVGPMLVRAVVDGGSILDLWLYLVGPLAGGAVAALLYNWMNLPLVPVPKGEQRKPAATA